MRSGVAQALRPRVWHDCALFFFDLGISYFAGFGTRLGRILAVQNQINPLYSRVRLRASQGGVSGSGTRRSLKKILKSSFERSRRVGHDGAFKTVMKRNSDNENLGQSQKFGVGN